MVRGNYSNNSNNSNNGWEGEPRYQLVKIDCALLEAVQ